MQNDPSKVTGSMTLAQAPSEAQCARIRLYRAAMIHANAILQGQVAAADAYLGISDLSLRRAGGKAEFELNLEQLDKTAKDLEDAALAFTDAARTEATDPHRTGKP